MPTIRLSRRLWNEYAARNAAKSAAEKRREQLILESQPMVERIARQVHRKMTHLDIEDIRQAGYIGLLEAADRYQPTAGVFEHYAYFRVRGAMIDAHKRSAYRDETHDSLEGIYERLGFLPAHLSSDKGLLPDALAARREQARLLAAAVNELAPDERRVFVASLAGTPLIETAADCGRSVAWARSKLAAARAQLGARVQMWGLGLDKAA